MIDITMLADQVGLALQSATRRQDTAGLDVLLRDYFDITKAQGVPFAEAWSQLSRTQHRRIQHLLLILEETGVDVDELLQSWTLDAAGAVASSAHE